MMRTRKNIGRAYGFGAGDAAIWERTLRLLAAGRLDVEPVITHHKLLPLTPELSLAVGDLAAID